MANRVPEVLLPLLGLGCPLIPALFVTWLAYFVIIEVIDQRLELKRDAISDSLHVLFGAWIVGVLPNYGQALLIMAGWGLVLAYGYWRRT